MRKLTLSAEPAIIDQAKQIARERGTSVSNLFSQHIQDLGKLKNVRKLGPKTKQAVGLLKLPKGKTERELIVEAMTERHMK